MPKGSVLGQVMRLDNCHNNKDNYKDDNRQDSKNNCNSWQRILRCIKGIDEKLSTYWKKVLFGLSFGCAGN